MNSRKPPHQDCWVQTKWGRHKAFALKEYMQVGGIHDGHIYVEVKINNPCLSKCPKPKVFSIEHIEYITE